MKKNKTKSNIISIIFGTLYALLSCCFFPLSCLPSLVYPFLIAVSVVMIFLLNFAPVISAVKAPTVRLGVCRHGVICLKGFICALILSVLFHIVLAFRLLPDDWLKLLMSALFCISTISFLFWNGMITVYCASIQLGVKGRVKGLLMGLVPIANIVMLFKIIKTVQDEINFETAKIETDNARKADMICKTKYPLLFVHGVFFRDFKHVNYWGRIPDAVIKNGGKIYYGDHQSAASTADAGQELAERIKQITDETGCEKVNIIAHSKGGLDSRYAIANCGIADRVASLTTINTPHRGCLFAEYLLDKLPQGMQTTTASAYNAAMKSLGDPNPDFLAAVNDLRAEVCAEFDKSLTVPDTIYKQSVGSILTHATGGKFPLNFSYHLVKHFDGPNDGLVRETAFSFGESYTLLKPTGNRGISHGDMIDLNRENIEGFDVREFYVQLVSGLREKGL